MDIEELQKKIGERLKNLRMSRGLKQEDIEEKWNFPYRHYGKIERGKHLPNISTLNRLCEIFNISLSDLFLDIEDKELFTGKQQALLMKILDILKRNDELQLDKLELFIDRILC